MEASTLDVEDLVDLCYAKEPDDLRVGIYLEALRGRSGEKAQVAACLLCFDLARRGDERREGELQMLLPTLDGLLREEDELGLERESVRVLIETSAVVAQLWESLRADALRRDRRAMPVLPDEHDIDAIEVDLFDEDEFAELALELEDIDIALDLDEEVHHAFEAGLNTFIPAQPRFLYAANDAEDLERVEHLRAHCASFAGKLSIAAEMEVMTELYVATHTRAQGLFGRRNRRRDRALRSGVAALLKLPSPPTEAVAWFEGTDLPGSDAYAWPKLAEVMLDLMSFVGNDIEANPRRYEGSPNDVADAIAEAYVAGDSSAAVKTRLLPEGERRRRR